MNLTLDQIATATGAKGGFAGEVVAQGYSIDSRTTCAGDLFFAVKGERLDGHDFVEQAFVSGAAGANEPRKLCSEEIQTTHDVAPQHE